MTRRAVLAALGLLVAGAGLLLVLRWPTGSSDESDPGAVVYAALGDSIASGHGLDTGEEAEPFDNAFGRAERNCHRSAGDGEGSSSYADLVAAEIEPADFLKIACSGDTTGDVAEHQLAVANAELGGRPALVTLTVGGNNYRFEGATSYARAFTPIEADAEEWRLETEAGVRSDVAAALAELGSGHPERTILVTGYFNPFNDESVIYSLSPTCQSIAGVADDLLGDDPPFDLGGLLDESLVDCADRIDLALEGLNRALAGAVDDYRAASGESAAQAGFVDGVLEAFAGHEAPRPHCGTADPEVADTYFQSPGTPLAVELLLQTYAGGSGDDCFHPAPAGHRALATLVLDGLAAVDAPG